MSTPQLRLNAEQKASLGVTVGTATSSSSSATSSPTSTPSCAAAASSSSGTSSSSNSTPVIAVGASLGVAFLVAAGLFGWEKRKTHRLRSELQQHRAELQQRYQYSGPPVPAKTGYRQQPTETGEELQKARAATRARHELDSGSRPHGGISEADEDRGYNDRKRWP